MRKKELLKRATERYNSKHKWSVFTPNMIEGALSAVVDVLIEALVAEGKVTVRGLASLDIVDYGDKNRGVWNPYKQEPMEYKPKKKIRCRFSKRIRDAINGDVTSNDDTKNKNLL